MFIVNWVRDSINELLSWLGLLPEDAKILFLGLDNAGKTTLLRMMKDDRMTSNYPTLHPHAEELYVGNRRFRAFDLGGHEVARKIWKDYYADTDAIFFLVDAADRTRMAEAREELKKVFETESLRHVPIAVLGNKIDIPTACSEEELRSFLQIPISYNYNMNQGGQNWSYRPGGGPVDVFMCSLLNKMGYSAAFKFISDVLKQQKKK